MRGTAAGALPSELGADRAGLKRAILAARPTHRAGDYLLIYDTIGGVPHTPTEIYIYYLPVNPRNRDNVSSMFIEDSWRATDRITLNLTRDQIRAVLEYKAGKPVIVLTAIPEM